VSKQYAGEELFNKIQNECIKQEPGNVIIIRPSLKILTYIFDQKSLGQKPNCPGMIIGRSSTIFLFFIPIGNPRWPPPQYID
jgi:hypothetical protein